MNLYTSIERRKSCRKYDMKPLDDDVIREIEDAIKGFKSLYPEVAIEHRFSKKVKGRFHVDSPHYLIISGQGNQGELENAGFMFEQLVLWLDAKEIGSVWLGASKDAEGEDTKNDIIVLAFGNATESVHRTKEEFKRKPIHTITNAAEEPCIQAVHLAPSGMNTQPWYFEKEEDKVLVYRQKLKPPVSMVYKLSEVDMGIALCHYAVACEETGKPFSFIRETTMPGKDGYLPFGVISE